MDYTVVIAKYNESIDWVQNMDHGHIVLYDKSESEKSAKYRKIFL